MVTHLNDVTPATDPDTVEWLARRTITQHEEPPSPDRATGRCAQCQPNGWCELLHWSRTIVLASGLKPPHG